MKTWIVITSLIPDVDSDYEFDTLIEFIKNDAKREEILNSKIDA
jgi:hypothetical protein